MKSNHDDGLRSFRLEEKNIIICLKINCFNLTICHIICFKKSAHDKLISAFFIFGIKIGKILIITIFYLLKCGFIELNKKMKKYI